MKLNKKLYDAIEVRSSRRKYLDKPLNSGDKGRIEKVLKDINLESGFRFQFIEDGEKLFKGFKASYGLISGVKSFIALVGKVNSEELKVRAGYYGELAVLECTALGLGTCWIGGTYDKEETRKCVEINNDEELICVIAIGYVNNEKSLKERMISKLSKNSISIENILIEKDRELPKWVTCGINAVMKAPSALNKKPIAYKYINGKVEALIAKENHGYEHIDLGISMLHFELGAKSEGIDSSWSINNRSYIFE